MASPHLTMELIRRWFKGAVDDRTFLNAVLPHLTASCPTCNVIWTEATRGLIPGRGLFAKSQLEGDLEGLSSEDAIQRALEKIGAMKSAALLQGSQEQVATRLDSLFRKPYDEQLATIKKSRSAYVHPQIAAGLIEHSRSVVCRDPELSWQAAVLAATAAKKVQKKSGWRAIGVDLHAHSVALQGNARRLLGEYEEARYLLRTAHLILDHGSGDIVRFGDILCLDASLQRELYQFDDAIRSIRQAMKIYRRCGEEHKLGRAEMKLSLIYSEAGDSGNAVAAIRSALEHLDVISEPHLEVLAYENLALFLAEAGDPHRGLEILREHLPSMIGNRRAQLRREWLEARIQLALGEYSKASATFSVLQQDFARLGDTPSAVVVSLDLAAAFAAEGLTQEVKRVVKQTFPLVQEAAFPQEIWAALMLFKQAANAERVESEVLLRIREVVADRRKWRRRPAEN